MKRELRKTETEILTVNILFLKNLKMAVNHQLRLFFFGGGAPACGGGGKITFGAILASLRQLAPKIVFEFNWLCLNTLGCRDDSFTLLSQKS